MPYNRTRKGGFVIKSDVFEKILSIGFEFETIDLIKLTKHEGVFYNSALKNDDITQGLPETDIQEYFDVDISSSSEGKKIEFHISNDTVNDNDINDYFNNHFKNINKKEQSCQEFKDKMFRLEVVDNETNNSSIFPVHFFQTESDYELCSTFSDTEWIVTFFDPQPSKNIIFDCFKKAIHILHNHLSELIPHKAYLQINADGTWKTKLKPMYKEIYHCPDTNLYYLNACVSHRNGRKNFKINGDVQIVPQMTFSCHVTDFIDIGKKLLKTAKKYRTSKNFAECFLNSEIITDEIIRTYNAHENKYKLSEEDVGFESFKTIKTYLLMIIYKIFVHLNTHISDPDDLLKYNLDLCLRHSNFTLYENLKKHVGHAFGVSENFAITIVKKIVDIYTYDKIEIKKIFDKLYEDKTVRSKVKKVLADCFPDVTKPTVFLLEKKPEFGDVYYGDPVYSLATYFDFFENPVMDDNTMSSNDWFEYKEIDIYSARLDLIDDIILCEFRDFPYHINETFAGYMQRRNANYDPNLVAISLTEAINFLRYKHPSKTRKTQRSK